jgi:hypothetical protein
VFTRAKSDIKALDYAGLGVPAVYSDVGPYARSVVHGETGLLAGNEPAAWVESLRALVADEPLRRKLTAGAREWMLSGRVLRRRAGDWPQAIETIRQSRRLTTVVAVPEKPLTARVVVPGSVNYFYDRAGERVAEALRGIGVAAEVTTLAPAANEEAAADWCFLVNPYEIAAGHGDQADAIDLMRGMVSRSGRCVAVALECVQTPWFSHSVRLCRDAGLDAILDLGFHSQLDELPDDVAGMYHFCFNGLTASERRVVPVAPTASERPIPWVLVGHQSAERAELAYRLAREGPPDGIVYLPRLSPVTESGPHHNRPQFQRVLSHAQVQLWCSHHPHFYMESERFRDSLLTGSVPLKVVDRPPDASRVFPFEQLVTGHDEVPAWVRGIDYAAAWARFREEFLALPSLEEGLAAFVGVAPPADADAPAATSAPARQASAHEAKGVLLAV